MWVQLNRDAQHTIKKLEWQLPVDLNESSNHTFYFVAKPNQAGLYSISIHANQSFMPKVLVVDDQGGSDAGDGSTASEFSSLLTQLGYDVTLCTLPANTDFDCSEGYTLSLSFLQTFDAVVWSTGDLYGDTIGNGAGSQAELLLIDYINNGGRLILEGGDIGYDRGSSDPNNFMSNVAHATYVSDITSDNPEILAKVSGNENHPVIANLPSTIEVAGGTGSYYPDNVDPANGGIALMYWQTDTSNGLIAYDGINAGNNDNARVVYMAFSFDGLDSTNQEILLRDAMKWVTNIYETGEVVDENAFVRVYGTEDVSLTLEAPSTMKSNSTAIVNVSLSNNGEESVVKLNLIINITNESCPYPNPEYQRFRIISVNQGDFREYAYDDVNNVINLSGLELQPAESTTVSFELRSPICYSEVVFGDAVVAEAKYTPEHNLSLTKQTNMSTTITVQAFNRGHISASFVEKEISVNASTLIHLRLVSDGDVDVTSIDYVNLTLPLSYSVDPASISNGGTYNATTHTIEWHNLGNLSLGNSITLYFMANSSSEGTFTMYPYVVYSDAVGSQTSTNAIQQKVIKLPVSLSLNPSIVKPGGTTTLTVVVLNSYSSSITSVKITPSIPSNWSISPSQISYDSIQSENSERAQFLVEVSDKVGTYPIKMDVTYYDVHNVLVTRKESIEVEVATRPDIKIKK